MAEPLKRNIFLGCTTMTYPEQVKSLLWSDIQEMSKCPGRYAKNPEVDFSRKRKIDFENLMRFLISMESGTTAHELASCKMNCPNK